jgi:hypothetical protein
MKFLRGEETGEVVLKDDWVDSARRIRCARRAGKVLVSGSPPRLISSRDFAVEHVFDATGWSCATSEDCRTVAFGSAEGVISIYRGTAFGDSLNYVSDGEFRTEGCVRELELTLDGKSVMSRSSGDGRCRVWDLPLQQPRHNAPCKNVAFCGDGENLLLEQDVEFFLWIGWKTRGARKIVLPMLGSDRFSDLVVTTSGEGLASYEDSRLSCFGPDGLLRWHLRLPRGESTAMRLSDDQRTLVVGDFHGWLSLYRVSSGELLDETQFPPPADLSDGVPIMSIDWIDERHVVALLGAENTLWKVPITL